MRRKNIQKNILKNVILVFIKDIKEIYLDETIPEYQILKLKDIVNQISNNKLVFEKVKNNINKIGIIQWKGI